MIYILITGIAAFLVIACIALIKNDEVRAQFGSSFFHINLETQRRQKKLLTERLPKVMPDRVSVPLSDPDLLHRSKRS